MNPIEFFGDGQQALAYLEKTKEQPFLILCDINMPRMNGIELRQRIDASGYLRKKAIPFIFLTTAGEDRLVELAYTSTIQGFFQKAHSYEDLKQQLNMIVMYWLRCSHPHTLFD
jgi:CheY-like chemotaxis protein